MRILERRRHKTGIGLIGRLDTHRTDAVSAVDRLLGSLRRVGTVRAALQRDVRRVALEGDLRAAKTAV